jgi:hypothetical protein
MGTRKFSISWQDTSIQVTSRIISRYAWTTASIDVLVAGESILSTSGVKKVTGGTSASFDYEGTSHRAVLNWGAGSLRSFPFKLEIDGLLIASSRVPVSNWWMAWWPLTTTTAVFLVWCFLRSA